MRKRTFLASLKASCLCSEFYGYIESKSELEEIANVLYSIANKSNHYYSHNIKNNNDAEAILQKHNPEFESLKQEIDINSFDLFSIDFKVSLYLTRCKTIYIENNKGHIRAITAKDPIKFKSELKSALDAMY